MKSSRWKDIAEMIGITAIVSSLVFVGLEIRQDQNLARADLASGTFEHMTSIEQQLMDSEVAAAFEKMLNDPESLSIKEMTQLNGLLHQVILMFQREDYLVGLGIYSESGGVRRQFASFAFGNTYAQSWLQAAEPRINPRQLASFRSELEALDPETTGDFYKQIKQGL